MKCSVHCRCYCCCRIQKILSGTPSKLFQLCLIVRDGFVLIWPICVCNNLYDSENNDVDRFIQWVPRAKKHWVKSVRVDTAVNSVIQNVHELRKRSEVSAWKNSVIEPLLRINYNHSLIRTVSYVSKECCLHI